MTFPYAYAVVVSDGNIVRTINSRALGVHREALEAALSTALGLDPPAAPPESPVAPPPPSVVAPVAMPADLRASAKSMGFTGDPCLSCGSIQMVRTGTCVTCQSCHQNSGCG